jgi:replicative DNA helicase
MTTEDLLAQVDKAHAEYTKLLDVGDDQGVTLAGDPAELDALIQNWGTPPQSALTTGIQDLDEALNVSNGSLVVIAARSGVDKSMLAQSICRHYALTRDEGATVFFSMEMSKTELRTRDLAALARIRTDSANGKTDMSARDWDQLEKARVKYEAVSGYHIEDGDMDIAHIRARLRYHVRQHKKLGLVVVDYLGLMKRPGRDRDDQELGAITRQLKLIAQEYGTIVMLVAQLNRNPEARVDGKPILSDLRGSGAIEQDADAVIMLHDVAKRDDTRLGEVDIILAKQRAGVTGTVVTVADRRAYADFGDLAKVEI